MIIADHSTPDIYGLILTGGHSTRMGIDKSLIHYHGKPQREYLFELLGKFCSTVFTSCRKEQHVPPTLNPLYDQSEIRSPMNGILSAFHFSANVSWLIVAVDMPYVDEMALTALLENRDGNKLATCFLNEEVMLPEPLLALWEPAAFPWLSEFTRNGNTSPRDFLKTHPIHCIPPPDNKMLTNFNYPHQIPLDYFAV